MEQRYSITLRALCAMLGAAYALEAALALIALRSPVLPIVALGMMAVAFVTARTLPGDADVPLGAAVQNSKVALVLLGLGFISILVRTESSLSWVCIVHAYCAGNRLKAADLWR
ncbi:MAG: hypothetical protein ABI471_04270 [Sphingomonas bacterium]